MTPGSPPLRAGLYARKSKVRRRRYAEDAGQLGRSVVEQLDAERAWCAANNCVVVDEYIDDDRSASRFTDQEREEFERLLADIAANRLDIVVAWESARYQRDLAIYVELREACRRAGVLYCYGGRIYDMRDRNDRRTTAYDAIRDEDESEAISERVGRALRANAKHGRPHGRQLYGYRREYDGKTGKLSGVVIDDRPMAALAMACMTPRALVAVEWYTPAQIIREIVERVIDAHALNAIVTGLNRRGIPSPRRGLWTHSTIRQLATNPAFIGRRRHNDELVADAIWEPLLDEDMFLTAGAILSRPDRKTYRDGAVKHLLSAIAECEICQSPAGTAPGRHGDYRGYTCGPHRHFMVRKERIDAYVEMLLVGRLSQPDAAELFAVERDPRMLADEREKVARWEEELRDGERLVEAGEMTMRRLASMEQRLQPLIDAANERIKSHRLNPLLAKLINPDPELVWAEWEGLEIAQKRSVIRTCFEWIRIRPPGAGRRPPASEIVSHRWRTAR